MRKNNDRMLLESLVRKYGKNAVKNAIKNVNESLTHHDYMELEQIVRALINNNEKLNTLLDIAGNLTPRAQKIISVYDAYVLDVFCELIDADGVDCEYIVERIGRMAEDNEWEYGTEASMIINFLTDIADEVNISINESYKINENIDDDFETRELIYREFYNAMEHACLSLQRKGIEITEDVVRTGVDWFDLHNEFYEV